MNHVLFIFASLAPREVPGTQDSIFLEDSNCILSDLSNGRNTIWKLLMSISASMKRRKKATTTDECGRHVERRQKLGISLPPIVVHYLVSGLSCLYSDFECQETIPRSL